MLSDLESPDLGSVLSINIAICDDILVCAYHESPDLGSVLSINIAICDNILVCAYHESPKSKPV